MGHKNMKQAIKYKTGMIFCSLALCLSAPAGAAESYQLAQSGSIDQVTRPSYSGVSGVGSPSQPDVSAPEVQTNPINPRAGQNSFADPFPGTGSSNTRPFPESRSNTNMFYKPAKPGVIGSSANEGVRPVVPPPVAPQGAAPRTQTNTQTGTQPRIQIIPGDSQPNLQVTPPSPANKTEVTITETAPEAPASVQRPPKIEIHGSDGYPKINVNAEGGPPIYADEMAHDALFAEQTLVVDQDDDDDDMPITHVVLWSVMSVLLMLLASVATWFVIRRRRETRLNDF